ncbi:MAG: S-layer homology domain-containing protein [Clostridiales Family XIII bacterium]|nr:S-layer homology domain-containing protein [Clostridiales Family XIII bacterium]
MKHNPANQTKFLPLKRFFVILLALALLSPSCAFAEGQNSVVKVDPSDVTLSRGDTEKFGAYVDIPLNENPAVVWSIEGASDSVITETNLTIGAKETSATFRVVATSVSRPGESGFATVTVLDPYVPPSSTVTGVTVIPNAVSVEKGTYQKFTVEVTGTGDYDPSVAYGFIGKTSNSSTRMTSSGLFVAADETSGQFTLYFESIQNPSVRGSAIITVTDPIPPGTGTVTGITLSPERSQISHLSQSQLQFSAAVAGTGDYDSGITWGVYSRLVTTVSSTINQNGLLTVPVSERSEVLYVTATSKQNPNIRAETLVTVTNTPAPTQITDIIMRYPELTLERGKSAFIYVDIYGTNGYHSEGPYGTLTWRIEPVSSTSTIDAFGEIIVAADEPNQKLTVYATSTLDPSVSGSAAFNVTGGGSSQGSTVTGVRITKPQFTNVIYVAKGKAYAFEALVEGSGNPDQAVSWELANTSLSYFTGNTLYVSNYEIASELTAIARSVKDGTKYASARVILGIPPVVIDSISVSSESNVASGTAWIRPGDTRQYKATVKGSYGLEPVPQDVAWRVLYNTDSNTTIDSSGFLRVGTNETADHLIIDASSVYHQGMPYGSTSVYPRKAVNSATVLGITPATANLIPGVKSSFAATVNGEKADPSWFSWSITTPGASAAVDAYGAVTVGANQAIGSTLTVRATAKDYPQKYAEAAVTVAGATLSPAPAGGGGGGGGGSPAAAPAAATPEPATVLPDKTTPLASSAPASAANPVDKVFADVPASAWFRDSVQYVYDKGYFQGVGDGSFAPGATMTRGMFVTALGRLASIDAAAYTQASLVDVNPGDWFAPYTEWAYRNQIVSGTGNGYFSQADPVTREQLAVIIYNYARLIGLDVGADGTDPGFADAGQISEWATDAVRWLADKGVILGRPGNLADPKGLATRAEVATILMRLTELIPDPVA